MIALRLAPILAAAATVGVTIALTGELGGGRFARSLAGTATALTPAYLLLGNTLTTTSFEPLSWTLVIYACVRRSWAAFGFALAFAAYGKYSVLLLAAGVAAGFLLTGEHRAGSRRWAIASVALNLVLENLVRFCFGNDMRGYDLPLMRDLRLGELRIGPQQLQSLALALAIMAAMFAFLLYTRFGKAMRATFQDRDTAALMGVRIDRIHTGTFALGSGLAAAAGALLGPVFVVNPTMGDLAASKAFAIVILGGLGNIKGATLGGFILAFAEEIGAGYVSSGYRDAMGFLLIILILLVRPTGLFAQKERVG